MATPEQAPQRRRRLRISIRYKMLLAVSAALLFAVGTYGYLAISTFTADKLAYIYDLNATMIASLTEQTRSSLQVLSKALNLFANEVSRSAAGTRARRASAQDLFTIEPDILRAEIYTPTKGRYTVKDSFANRAAVEATELTMSDLQMLRHQRPVPFDAIVRQKGVLYVQNSSLPPAAAVLTVAYQHRNGDQVIVVDMRHERLLRIFTRSQLHRSFLVDDQGEVIAHPDPGWVIQRRNLASNSLVKEALNAEVDQGVREFVAEDGSVQLGAYAQVGVGRLWVVTHIPRAEALRASREMARRTALFALAVLLAAFIASIFFSRVVTSPIRRLRAATEVIGQGHFDVQINVESRDEIGDLAHAFERMATALKQVQGQLVQSEKMAAFGQLGAGITHEVKNPMTGIISFAQLAQRKLDDKDKLLEFLELIEKEALRCRDILVNFLKFARVSGRDLEPLDVNELVDTAATMLRHQLNINNVRLEVELADGVPKVLGHGPELQQVLMNLALNAQQAMPRGGRVVISTEVDPAGGAIIRVADNGPGIPPDIKAKVFEPFFTTKAAGEGTGLGLSVSFGIIKAHKGTLVVEDTPGGGATFLIHLSPNDVGEAESPPVPIEPPEPTPVGT